MVFYREQNEEISECLKLDKICILMSLAIVIDRCHPVLK